MDSDRRAYLVKLMGFKATEIAPKVQEILDELVREHEQFKKVPDRATTVNTTGQAYDKST